MASISIVIPCFNSENYICNCLKSIENQESEDIEIIIVDDKSTDNTVNVINEYKKNSKMQIKLFQNEKNIGAGLSRNKGIKYCEKEYLLFIDSDDCIRQDFFKIIQNVLNGDTYDCVIFDARYEKKGINSYIKMFYSSSIHEGDISCKTAVALTKGGTCGKIYRSDIIKKNKIKFSNLIRAEDLVFTKCALSYIEKIYYIEKPLYIYKYNENSLMNIDSLLNENNEIQAFNEIKKNLCSRGFVDELNCIYFIEVIYSTSITLIKKGESKHIITENFNDKKLNYVKKNIYYDKLSLQYKIVFFLLKYHMYWIISFLLKIK